MSKTTPAALLRLSQVLAQFPVLRATWYAGVKDGRYPRRVQVGPRAVAWKPSDVDRLIAALSPIDSTRPD